MRRPKAKRINLRHIDAETVGVSLDETVDLVDLQDLWSVFNGGQPLGFEPTAFAGELAHDDYPAPFARTRDFLTHPVFNRFHTETEMLRYLKRLESKDLSLTTSMIPLGSCTMKLNATTEMFPVTWPEFGQIHPFAPAAQTEGYRVLAHSLEKWLGEITGTTRREPCNPTLGRRANTPGCSPSAATRKRAARAIAKSASSPRARTAPTRPAR